MCYNGENYRTGDFLCRLSEIAYVITVSIILILKAKNSDGTKNKDKVLDSSQKVKYEKYGHLNDCFEMALCYFLSDEYKKYKKKQGSVPTPYTANIQPVWRY